MSLLQTWKYCSSWPSRADIPHSGLYQQWYFFKSMYSFTKWTRNCKFPPSIAYCSKWQIALNSPCGSVVDVAINFPSPNIVLFFLLRSSSTQTKYFPSSNVKYFPPINQLSWPNMYVSGPRSLHLKIENKLLKEILQGYNQKKGYFLTVQIKHSM